MSEQIATRSKRASRAVELLREYGSLSRRELRSRLEAEGFTVGNDFTQHMEERGLIRRADRGFYEAGSVYEPSPVQDVVSNVISLDAERAKRAAPEPDKDAFITAFGYRKRASQWSADQGVPARIILQRLSDGWSPEDAVTHALRTDQQEREMWPGANHVRFKYDRIAQKLVERNGEMSLEAVGKFMGMTRERVRQIEDIALRKLRAGLASDGFPVNEHDLHAMLREMTELRDAKCETEEL